MLASVAEVAGRALSTRRGSGRNADMTPSANRDRFVSASQMHIVLLHAPLSLLRPNDLTIRAWLGHVSLDATNIYAEADLEMKANALAHCDLPPPAKREKKRRRFSGTPRRNSCAGKTANSGCPRGATLLRIHGTIGVAMRAFLAR